MKKVLPVLTALFSFLALASGCQPPSGDGDIEIRPAPIYEVNIMLLKSDPPQVEVYIKGGLADSCTLFHELKVKRDGKIINITVTTQHPRKAVCAQGYSYFEKTVNLGADFSPGETYLVKVNNKIRTFTF